MSRVSSASIKKNSSRIRALSLFSGAMGLDLGLERAGVQVVGCIEFMPEACETIRLNRPEIAVIEGDISTIAVDEVLVRLSLKPKDIDLLVGGPPCQAFSVFGRRRGVKDGRGRLIYDYVRFVEEIRPRAFIMENVRGLMSTRLTSSKEKGSLLKDILGRFTASGYRVDVFVVNAVNYGAPQIRERVIIIGNREGRKAEFPFPTHSDKPINGQALFRTLGDVIRNLPDTDPTIMDFSPRKKNYLKLVPPGGNWRSLPIKIQKESMGKSWYLKGGRSAYWRRLAYEFPCPTVVTMPNHAGTSMCHPEEIRALTVGECSAIQGFPADWKIVGSPQRKYEQVGNAVPIILGELAGAAVISMLTTEKRHRGLDLITETHIRPHVRTRQYWKSGKVFGVVPYQNNQNRYQDRMPDAQVDA